MIQFLDDNTLENLRENVHSKAGEQREEILEFVDFNNDPAIIENPEKLKIRFAHNKKFTVQVLPDSVKFIDKKLHVKWTPIPKGTYSMMIEDCFVDAAQNLAVIGAELDPSKAVFRPPTSKKYAYYE